MGGCEGGAVCEARGGRETFDSASLRMTERGVHARDERGKNAFRLAYANSW